VYAVVVEVDSPVKGATSALKWETDRDPDSIRRWIGNVQFDADVFVIETRDKDGQDHLLFQFYQLLPSRPRHILVTGVMPVQSSGHARIARADAQPEHVFTQ
jgi:hypothetical protein